MTSMKSSIVGGLAFACAAFATTPSAHATTYHSPYGNADVNATVGYRASTGETLVVFQRKSDNHCTRTRVGYASLWGSIAVQTGDGNDTISIPKGNGSVLVYCSDGMEFLRQPVSNGNYIDGIGGGGNDFIQVGENYSYGIGGSGDDRLVARWANASLWGGSGDDVLLKTSSGGSWNRLYGESGNDCLYAQDFNAQVVSCGSGSDAIRTGMTATNGDCEIQTPTFECEEFPMSPVSARTTLECQDGKKYVVDTGNDEGECYGFDGLEGQDNASAACVDTGPEIGDPHNAASATCGTGCNHDDVSGSGSCTVQE